MQDSNISTAPPVMGLILPLKPAHLPRTHPPILDSIRAALPRSPRRLLQAIRPNQDRLLVASRLLVARRQDRT